MIPRMIRHLVLISLLIILISCDQPLGTTIDISGRWTGNATNFVDIGDGSTTIIITFDQDKERLSGSLTTSLGSRYEFTGSILRDDVFFFWRNTEDDTDHRFTGLYTGRTISGTWRMGDMKTFETLKNGQWTVSR
ncbi:MAG: hypothetical protein EA364_05975 [Balneolaceae bacterium]|jgi:hypothetical protein|nr:MAG: hypothetical protein EA364_05975 [Balneolaceae bacterium]